MFLYLILLSKSKFLFLKSLPLFNFFKIAISTAIMSFALYYGIGFFEDKLIYSNNYKSIYLLIMIGLVTTIYLIFCYLFGLLKIKNYKTIKMSNGKKLVFSGVQPTGNLHLETILVHLKILFHSKKKWNVFIVWLIYML